MDNQGLIKSRHFLTALWENKENTHTQGSYLFMPLCFLRLHLFLFQLLPLQTQGRNARDGMHEQKNQHITHLPTGTSLPSQVRNNVIYLCCSAVSADTELLTDCTVSLCHLRAQFYSDNEMFYWSEFSFSLWVNATLFSALSQLQKFMYLCRLNTTHTYFLSLKTLFCHFFYTLFIYVKWVAKHTLVEFRHGMQVLNLDR